MARRHIKERMIGALREHGECGFLPYHELARLVFPSDQYPRAFNYPNGGGPPGCYMALSRAIREHDFSIQFFDAKDVTHATVGLGRNRRTPPPTRESGK